MLSSHPVPRVRVRARGGLTAVFQYRQFERPASTSLAMLEVSSRLIDGGGGSWTYEARDGGTVWSQVNTLVVKPGLFRRGCAVIAHWQLRRSTIRAMRSAKAVMER